MNATVAKWYEQHGRHDIYAGGKDVNLESYDHSLRLNAEDVDKVRDNAGRPQTARDEKMARRKASREAAMVREYYEETVLKKKKDADLVQINLS